MGVHSAHWFGIDQVYICDPNVIMNSIAFNSPKCPGLDAKSQGHYAWESSSHII